MLLEVLIYVAILLIRLVIFKNHTGNSLSSVFQLKHESYSLITAVRFYKAFAILPDFHYSFSKSGAKTILSGQLVFSEIPPVC